MSVVYNGLNYHYEPMLRDQVRVHLVELGTNRDQSFALHVDDFGVPIRDMNAIVEKLEYLREHPEERLRMGQNARERAKIFTCDQYRDKAIFFIGSLRENGLHK